MENLLKKITGSGNMGMVYFYVGAAIIVLVEGLLLVSVLPNLYKELREKMTLADSRSAEVASYGSALKMLSQLESSQVDGYLGKVLLALPDEKKTSGIISGMTALASTSGVVVTDLEFSPGAVASDSGQLEGVSVEKVVDKDLNIRAVPASLTISASIDSLIVFLEKLANASQLIGVSAVSYTSSTPGQLKATISVLMYYQPRDISKFSWRGLKEISDEDANYIQNLPDEDLFILRNP